MAEEITLTSMSLKVHSPLSHLNHFTRDKRWKFNHIVVVNVLAFFIRGLFFLLELPIIIEYLQAQGMQEEVLPIDELIKVKACVLVFGNDSFPLRNLLFEGFLPVHLLGAHKSFK